MMLCTLGILFVVLYADEYYGVVLPGDVTNETTGRGYPQEIVPADNHGAAQYSGWGETERFARFYTIQYGSFSMKGEPKHGLWKWTAPGAGDKADIWWCTMAGSYNTSVSSGHINNDDQQNMEEIWEQIRDSDRVNEVGPLAEDANLLDISANVIRLYLSPIANVWLNRGTSTQPAHRSEALDNDDVEFYFIEHLYGYTDIPIWGGIECDGTNSDNCVNLHDTVVAVIRKEITEGLVGLPTWGVAYGNLSTAGPCPDPCGEGPCDCDLVLMDISLDGYLGTSYDDNDFFVPTWMKGNPIADVELEGTSTFQSVGGFSNSKIFEYVAQGGILVALLCAVHVCWRMKLANQHKQRLEEN